MIYNVALLIYLNMSIYDEIAKESGVNYIRQSAKALTTIKCGGVLEQVFVPANVLEFSKLIKAFENADEKPFLLGGGSNVLVADGDVKTPGVLTKKLDKIRIANGYVFCECGAKISEISRRAREYNLGGLEFLAGVPLTIGGAVKMNASAFSRQVFDFAESVFVFSSRACGERICELPRECAGYGYRKGVQGIVVGAKLKLARLESEKSILLANEYLAKRRAKQPQGLSLGSVFKNGEIPSGKLIEDCGLKGCVIGGAKISEKHANFIVNTGGATASDFLALAKLAEEEVKNKFGIQLEREFELIE